MAKDISNSTRQGLGLGLEGVLADSYALYNATQVCHWNVVGPRFHSLHELFEEQYTELADAIDEIAERIRSLGFFTRGRLSDLVEATRIETPESMTDSAEMLTHLIDAQQTLIDRLAETREIAEDLGDEVTIDLLVERARVHETESWMLKAQAGESFESLPAPKKKTRSVA